MRSGAWQALGLRQTTSGAAAPPGLGQGAAEPGLPSPPSTLLQELPGVGGGVQDSCDSWEGRGRGSHGGGSGGSGGSGLGLFPGKPWGLLARGGPGPWSSSETELEGVGGERRDAGGGEGRGEDEQGRRAGEGAAWASSGGDAGWEP